MTITLRQESATGATTKGSSLTYAELDNNFIDLLNASRITVRGDSGTDQTLGNPSLNEILQIAGGTNVSTVISSDSAGETVLTINATAPTPDFQEGVLGGTDITVTADSTGQVTVNYTGSAISNVVEDTTPQLGGDLDLNSNDITGTGNISITGNVVAQSAINAQTGTTYTTVLGDANKLVTLSNASAITLTIPPNSSVAYPVGTKIDLAQTGAGQVTVAAGSGVTVNATPSLLLRAQYSAATCIKTATDTWLLVGDLETP